MPEKSKRKKCSESGWPTEGDISWWCLLKLIVFGERKKK